MTQYRRLPLQTVESIRDAALSITKELDNMLEAAPPPVSAESAAAIRERQQLGIRLRELAEILDDCGKLVSSSGAAQATLRAAADLLEPTPPVTKIRPCHTFTVTKSGSLLEWEPTSLAFELPDGKHPLYSGKPSSAWIELSDTDETLLWANHGLTTEQIRAVADALREKNGGS